MNNQREGISHPLNNMYCHSFQVIPDLYVGTGFKITNQYTTNLTKEEWLQKKKEFWGISMILLESRIEGEERLWLSIFKAIEEPDEARALEILGAEGLFLADNSIQVLYDCNGNKFDVPLFLINDPQCFPQQKICDLNLIQEFEETVINILIRSVKFPEDLPMIIKSNQKVEELKTKVLQSTPENNICRLFINGREMLNYHFIGNYGIVEGQIIQAFL